jgi:hypothetical protein
MSQLQEDQAGGKLPTSAGRQAFQTLHSCDYVFLERALEQACSRLEGIEYEIRTFSPKSQSEIEREDAERRADFAMSMGVDLGTFPEVPIDVRASHQWQLDRMLNGRLEMEYVTIVMLSCAIAEAFANVMLSFLLAESEMSELIDEIDSWPLEKKWELAPRIVDIEYHFPNGSLLDQLLHDLVSTRNRIVHFKPHIEINGQSHRKGRQMIRKGEVDPVLTLKRFANIPYELALHAKWHFLHTSMPTLGSIKMPFPEHRLGEEQKQESRSKKKR